MTDNISEQMSQQIERCILPFVSVFLESFWQLRGRAEAWNL
jgi:hypothetical protein